METLSIIQNLRVQDVLDVAFLSVVAYHLYLWFQGTRALKAMVGLLGLGAVYTLARSWGLFLTTWVFQVFWQVLVILLIILFQSEIRQVLERLNPVKLLGIRKMTPPEAWIGDFVNGVFQLARRSIGALVVVERSERVQGHITPGQVMEAAPTPEILLSIFQKDSPLHDGAVIVADGRIRQVATYLPLSSEKDLPRRWGTRHRAALGLSKRADALVIVVSEERGEVSVAMGGNLRIMESPEKFMRFMHEAVAPPRPAGGNRWERLRGYVVRRWRTKALSLLVVSLTWLLFAGQQDFQASFTVPVESANLPAILRITEPPNPRVRITVRGLRKDVGLLDESNVEVRVDLSGSRVGSNKVRIGRGQVILPNDRVRVIRIQPPVLTYVMRERP
ncbi:MAG: diadenylate cyclase [Deltaproteobacteria bacterium]|nr:diadenylate cyclase [Deltaproteobacteria bacterium]